MSCARYDSNGNIYMSSITQNWSPVMSFLDCLNIEKEWSMKRSNRIRVAGFLPRIFCTVMIQQASVYLPLTLSISLSVCLSLSISLYISPSPLSLPPLFSLSSSLPLPTLSSPAPSPFLSDIWIVNARSHEWVHPHAQGVLQDDNTAGIRWGVEKRGEERRAV